jgi:hypothetical protein
VFFIWETDLLQIFRQFLVAPRDVFDSTTDPANDRPGNAGLARHEGERQAASAEDASDGNPGCALQFARRLSALVADNAQIEVQAIGHRSGCGDEAPHDCPC